MKNLPDLKKPTTQAALALVIVLLIDLFEPLGIAVGVLYLFCFFLICRQNKKTIIAFAIITSSLTIIKFLIFLSPTTTYMVFLNRVFTVFVITIVAILALRHRKLADTLNEERNIYIKELEEMLFMTSHKVRKPLATCLGLMNLVESDNPLTREELTTIAGNLKSNVLELDATTKELTIFIDSLVKTPTRANMNDFNII